MKTITAKVVVLGSQGVGKTSLVTRYETRTFTRNTSSTIGAAFSNFEIIINDIKVKMQVWDTAGQERFRSMAPIYYRGAHAAVLVYDISKNTTYQDINKWVRELSACVGDGLMMVLVGNKRDLDERRVVARDEGQNYASSIGAIFLETSARDATGIDELFEIIATEMLRRADDTEELDGMNSSVVTLNDSALPPAKNRCC